MTMIKSDNDHFEIEHLGNNSLAKGGNLFASLYKILFFEYQSTLYLLSKFFKIVLMLIISGIHNFGLVCPICYKQYLINKYQAWQYQLNGLCGNWRFKTCLHIYESDKSLDHPVKWIAKDIYKMWQSNLLTSYHCEGFNIQWLNSI